jgi:catechol 2,3-dioxygenase-like lactoylglutathione lyase family enzyme
MAKIQHIALSVPDPEKSAEFYVRCLGMRRVGSTDSPLATGVYLSDGVINLALLKFKTDEAAGAERGKSYVGVHHIGFVVEDLEGASQTIQGHGGTFFLDLPANADTMYFERKYRDPDGIIFDISHHGWDVGDSSADG